MWRALVTELEFYGGCEEIMAKRSWGQSEGRRQLEVRRLRGAGFWGKTHGGQRKPCNVAHLCDLLNIQLALVSTVTPAGRRRRVRTHLQPTAPLCFSLGSIWGKGGPWIRQVRKKKEKKNYTFSRSRQSQTRLTRTELQDVNKLNKHINNRN